MRVVFIWFFSTSLSGTTFAQLPYFSTQVGESTYLDESGKTRNFRDLEHFKSEIVPARAQLAAVRCLQRVDTLSLLVTKLQWKGSLTAGESSTLRDLLRRAQFGDHELLSKLATNTSPQKSSSIAFSHRPMLMPSRQGEVSLANAKNVLLSKAEFVQLSSSESSESSARNRYYASSETIDTIASVVLEESEIASLISAAEEYADLNQRAASYFLGIHMFLGEACRKGPLPVRSLKESAFFFHGQGGANALSSASFALSDAAQPSASVQLVSMALPISNLTVSSTASRRRDTTASQQVIDKMVYGALGNVSLEIPLLYRADKTTKAYLPLVSRIIADRIIMTDDLTETQTEKDFVAFGIGTFATLDFSVRNPIDAKRAGIYFRLSYELIGTQGEAGELLGKSVFTEQEELPQNTIYHLAKFDCGFRGTNGVVIGFQAPVRIKNRPKYLASDQWSIGVRVEPGKW